MGLYWVSGHAGVRGNETADELVRDGSVLKFLGNEPAVGVSRQDMRRGVRRWLVNQQWVRRQGLGDTQRQARELISVPCLGDKARFLSFNRTQPRLLLAFSLGIPTTRAGGQSTV